MLIKKVFAVVLVALFATMGTLTAQEKYAIIIGGNMNPGSSIPAAEQWNGGQNPGLYGFDEIWNDAYLAWEMLITENKPFGKGYHVDNVHVLFDNGSDFTFTGQSNRYKAGYNNEPYMVDENANYATIAARFSALAATITADDFLFVWIMGHGGNDANGYYFYSANGQKIYASQLNTWLGGIDAHKKTVFLSFPKSGGFAPVLEEDGTIVITACGATEGASRADDIAPGTPPIPFIENEVRNGITYNHGEVNYHLTAALTGQTPLEVAFYNNINLNTADLNSDNYITIKDAWEWTDEYVSLNETPELSDDGGIFDNTGLMYPTLLHSGLQQGEHFSVRGLIGISKNTTTGVVTSINIIDNSKVYFLNNSVKLKVDPYGTLIVGDHCQFIGTGNFNYIDIDPLSTFSFGSHLNISTDDPGKMWLIEINNILSDIDLDYADINNAWIIAETPDFDLTNSTLQTGSLVHKNGQYSLNINNSHFIDFAVSLKYGNPVVDSCSFTIPDNEQTLSAGDLLSIENCPAFSITDCEFTNAYGSGIELMNSGSSASGNHLISGTTITNSGTALSSAAAVYVYNSTVDIHDNVEFSGNPYGIKSLNGSEVSIIGNSNASYVHQTQQINDNSENQIYATYGAFPFEVEWNAIYDEDNDCLVKYIPDPSGLDVNLDVANNYWGVSFNAKVDLCPYSLYTFAPTWSLQTLKSGNSNEAKDLFYASKVYVDSGLFVQAELGHQQLIADYPMVSYATASLKELFVIEQALGEDYASLKTYYAGILNQYPNTELSKVANFLSNHCDIQLGNYSTAIAWYEAVIQNPPTHPDSLFAIIDLGNLYIEMQNDSLKSTPLGSMTEYKPQSLKQYTEYRDYLLALLHKSTDVENDTEIELHDEKTTALLPNTPNPFYQNTTLRYVMEEEAYVELEIFDYTGRHIKTINEGLKKDGQHNTTLFAENMKPGIYFCTIRCNGKITDTQKITLIK